MVVVRYYGDTQGQSLTGRYATREVANRAIDRLAREFGWLGIIVKED